MNELETIVLQKLEEMEAERRQEILSVRAEVQRLHQQVQNLKTRQDESGQQLLRLSKRYASLQPLAERLRNILRCGIHLRNVKGIFPRVIVQGNTAR